MATGPGLTWRIRVTRCLSRKVIFSYGPSSEHAPLVIALGHGKQGASLSASCARSIAGSNHISPRRRRRRRPPSSSSSSETEREMEMEEMPGVWTELHGPRCVIKTQGADSEHADEARETSQHFFHLVAAAAAAMPSLGGWRGPRSPLLLEDVLKPVNPRGVQKRAQCFAAFVGSGRARRGKQPASLYDRSIPVRRKFPSHRTPTFKFQKEANIIRERDRDLRGVVSLNGFDVYNVQRGVTMISP